MLHHLVRLLPLLRGSISVPLLTGAHLSADIKAMSLNYGNQAVPVLTITSQVALIVPLVMAH